MSETLHEDLLLYGFGVVIRVSVTYDAVESNKFCPSLNDVHGSICVTVDYTKHLC